MARHVYWLGVLSALPFAGCNDVDYDPVPVWTPVEEIDGHFRPQVQQVAPTANPGPVLRVLTFNVFEGAEDKPIADYMLTHPELAAADVIALQENEHHPGDEQCDAGKLASRLGMGYVFAPTDEDDDVGLMGMAILSRYPMQQIEVMRLHRKTETEVIDEASRAALAVTIDTANGPVRIVNIHLDVGLNIPERVLQLRPAVLDAPAPIVVLGDFNTNDYIWASEFVPLFPIDAAADTSQADALDDYMRTIGYATPTSELGTTWHGPSPDQRLDSIFIRGLVPGDRVSSAKSISPTTGRYGSTLPFPKRPHDLLTHRRPLGLLLISAAHRPRAGGTAGW